MGYFKDLREHIAALDKAGLLVKIDEQINKDTELMPLVRWQFRGLSEEERRAFMFTNVIDAKGRKYDIPVVVGTLAASRQIYGFGLQCAAGGNRRSLEQSAEQSDPAEDCRQGAGARRSSHGRFAAGTWRPWASFRFRFPRRVTIARRLPRRRIGSRKIPRPASSMSATTAAISKARRAPACF